MSDFKLKQRKAKARHGIKNKPHEKEKANNPQVANQNLSDDHGMDLHEMMSYLGMTRVNDVPSRFCTNRSLPPNQSATIATPPSSLSPAYAAESETLSSKLLQVPNHQETNIPATDMINFIKKRKTTTVLEKDGMVNCHAESDGIKFKLQPNTKNKQPKGRGLQLKISEIPAKQHLMVAKMDQTSDVPFIFSATRSIPPNHCATLATPPSSLAVVPGADSDSARSGNLEQEVMLFLRDISKLMKKHKIKIGNSSLILDLETAFHFTDHVLESLKRAKKQIENLKKVNSTLQESLLGCNIGADSMAEQLMKEQQQGAKTNSPPTSNSDDDVEVEI